MEICTIDAVIIHFVPLPSVSSSNLGTALTNIFRPPTTFYLPNAFPYFNSYVFTLTFSSPHVTPFLLYPRSTHTSKYSQIPATPRNRLKTLTAALFILIEKAMVQFSIIFPLSMARFKAANKGLQKHETKTLKLNRQMVKNSKHSFNFIFI